MSGSVVDLRPPKMIALIGTPLGSIASGASMGLFVMGDVKRLFGCAAHSPGFHGRPRQSSVPGGGSSPLPSHQTSPSGVSATLVYIVSRWMICMAFGFDLTFVPGATPKYPNSGLIA